MFAKRCSNIMHAAFADATLAILGLVFATVGLGIGVLIGYLISKNRKY
jgi:hypothetical protein